MIFVDSLRAVASQQRLGSSKGPQYRQVLGFFSLCRFRLP
jgi:hypothetical protein